MSNMTVLMAVGAIAALQPSASIAKDIPFTITWIGGALHGIRCIQLEPFRQSGCMLIGRGPLDHYAFYVAQDKLLPATGLWGCNLYASGACGGAPRANVGFCGAGGPQEAGSVDLFYDDTNLTVNRPEKCVSATAASVLGFNGEDDKTPAQDLDSYRYDGKAGEKVAVKLDVDGSVGGIGKNVTLRIGTESGAVLGQRTGLLPISLELTLPGTVEITVLNEPRGDEPFRGGYKLELIPKSGDVGKRWLKPSQKVEQ